MTENKSNINSNVIYETARRQNNALNQGNEKLNHQANEANEANEVNEVNIDAAVERNIQLNLIKESAVNAMKETIFVSRVFVPIPSDFHFIPSDFKFRVIHLFTDEV